MLKVHEMEEKTVIIQCEAVSAPVNPDDVSKIVEKIVDPAPKEKNDSCIPSDFGDGLRNFISVADCRPPIEVYSHHPAADDVAKAFMVAFRENGMDLGDSCSSDYLQDATRFLFNLTSDVKAACYMRACLLRKFEKAKSLKCVEQRCAAE
jgi:hypothetical protein